MDSATAKQQIVERVKQANKFLVTVNANPTVDQLAACIGLTLMLNRMGKHATAVFSGMVPNTIQFLQPDKTLQKNTDALRDFIISLDKNKADKLRYKVEDDVVRIFITPYHTSISQKDLIFSDGDINVEAVIALGVNQRTQLDKAITAHGRIMHDATVISLNAGLGKAPDIGQINWAEPTASSLSEMLVSISEAFGTGLIDSQIATAYLTGIVAETERFSNPKTTPKVMTMSAQLMAAGANQQLIAEKLEPPPPPPPPPPQKPPEPPKKPPPPPKPKQPPLKPEGVIDVPHDGDKKPEKSSQELGTTEIHIDEQGNLIANQDLRESSENDDSNKVVPDPAILEAAKYLNGQPPQPQPQQQPAQAVQPGPAPTAAPEFEELEDDETRHGQLQTYFPYQALSKEPRLDWAHKAYHTNEWGMIAARHLFDDMFTANDAVSMAIQLTFTFETGFTNLQFLGMAADAMKVGDIDFGALISSIQTDEARHAQQGEPTLKILVAAGKKDIAQNLFDRMFWRAWKVFALLTGLSMDYYTPLEHRTHSFKEFMEEFINTQFIDQFRDFGLEAALVLGPPPQRDELAAPRLPPRRLLLAPHRVVEPGRGRHPGRAGVAGGEVPGLERVLREVLGRHGRERAGRAPRADPARDVPDRLQQLPDPGVHPGRVRRRLPHQPAAAAARPRRAVATRSAPSPASGCSSRTPGQFKGHLSIIDRFLGGVIQPPTIPGRPGVHGPVARGVRPGRHELRLGLRQCPGHRRPVAGLPVAAPDQSRQP